MLYLKPYFLAILVSAFIVAACGQTGDLYLPEDEPKSEQEKTAKEESKT